MSRNPINPSLSPEQALQRRLAEIESGRYPVAVRKAGGIATGAEGKEGPTGPEGKEGKEGPEGPEGKASSDFKESCRASTTANITISTALNNADVLDGVTLATGDRVLVKNQTTTKENGIWIVGVTPVRSADADAAGELSGGAMVYVEEGTINADQVFSITTNGSITPGTTSHVWQPIGPMAISFNTEGTRTAGGCGCTVAKTATGKYTITFNNELPQVPVAIAQHHGAGFSFSSIAEATKLVVKIETYNGVSFALEDHNLDVHVDW